MQRISIVIAVSAVLAATSAGAEDYRVERSLDITTSPQEAWHVAGDFCDIDDWHPAFVDCKLGVIDGALHRTLTTDEGDVFVEKRIAVEPGLSYTYSVVNSPLAVENLTATFSITRGDPSTITWSSRFKSDDPAMEQAVIGVYEDGLAALSGRLKN